jgi:hypothetical protein
MSRFSLRSSVPAAVLAIGVLAIHLSAAQQPAAPASSQPRQTSRAPSQPASPPTAPALAANELGRILLLEYHLIGDKNAVYERTREGLRHDLELLYARGFRPVNIADILDKKVDTPAGTSPVVLVFDDASPSQFRYVEQNGKLEVDPTSAVGILLQFHREHPDWANKGVFCMLPAAQAGRAFFGDKGIEGQKTEWRFKKVQFLHEQGFELCNHTLYHARLDRAGEKVAEFIARGQMAIDSAVPGYKVRTLALPLGMWPKDRALAHRGSWTEPRTKKVVTYDNEAILEVGGGATRSPFDPKYNPLAMTRTQVIGDSAVARAVRQLEKAGDRYVSDGDAKKVARP